MKLLRKYGKYILFILFLLLIFILVFFKIKLKSNDFIEESDIVKEDKYELVSTQEEEKSIEKVFIDIKGAVVNPGVYEIENNKKVIDVINMAGGLREDADTSLINLAKMVTSEMVIVIYTDKEIKEAAKKESSNFVKPIDTVCNCPKITNDACISGNKNTDNNKTSLKKDDTLEKSNEKVNINTATIDELQTISGVGESKAKSIVEYRDNNGLFNSIEDIKNVSGIGDSLYEKIKDFITV